MYGREVASSRVSKPLIHRSISLDPYFTQPVKLKRDQEFRITVAVSRRAYFVLGIFIYVCVFIYHSPTIFNINSVTSIVITNTQFVFFCLGMASPVVFCQGIEFRFCTNESRDGLVRGVILYDRSERKLKSLLPSYDSDESYLEAYID